MIWYIWLYFVINNYFVFLETKCTMVRWEINKSCIFACKQNIIHTEALRGDKTHTHKHTSFIHRHTAWGDVTILLFSLNQDTARESDIIIKLIKSNKITV